MKCAPHIAGAHQPASSAGSLRKPETCTARTRSSLLVPALAPALCALGLFAVATVGLAISVTHAGAHSIPDTSACVSIYWTGEEPCHLADLESTVSRGWEAGNICSETIELHWGDNAHGSAIELCEADTPLRPGEVFGSHIACVDKPHLSWRADGILVLVSPVGAYQAGSSSASCFRRPGSSHGQTVMDDGQDCASKADLAPSATKAKLGALELQFQRETSAQDRRPIGALVAVAGIATAASRRA